MNAIAKTILKKLLGFQIVKIMSNLYFNVANIVLKADDVFWVVTNYVINIYYKCVSNIM